MLPTMMVLKMLMILLPGVFIGMVMSKVKGMRMKLRAKVAPTMVMGVMVVRSRGFARVARAGL
jgi:hypothetical protein